MTDEWTVKQAAKILGVHVWHVYRLLSDGRLEGRKAKGVWLVDAMSVARRKNRMTKRVYRGEK